MRGASARQCSARDLDRTVPVISYAGSGDVVEPIDAWLEAHESITSGDVVGLTGTSRPTAQRALGDLTGQSLTNEGAGQSTGFTPSAAEGGPPCGGSTPLLMVVSVLPPMPSIFRRSQMLSASQFQTCSGLGAPFM